MGFPFLRPRRKKQKVAVDKKEVETIIQQELAPYITRDELQDYIAKINADEKRKKLWDSLTTKKKIKVLRRVLSKKGDVYGKK